MGSFSLKKNKFRSIDLSLLAINESVRLRFLNALTRIRVFEKKFGPMATAVILHPKYPGLAVMSSE